MNEFRQARLEKLEKIRELGIDPFGSRFDDVIPVKDARDAFVPPEEGDEREQPVVRLAGRISAMRGHGKAGFLDITDRTGRIQVYIKKNNLSEEDFALYKLFDLADIIGIEGPLFTTRTGELTIETRSLRILTKALIPLPRSGTV